MLVKEYISLQLPERQTVLSAIHEIVVSEDRSVTCEIAPMMGKDMIIYKAGGVFKYGLASAKNYMSLHVLPIYGSEKLHTKYKKLLSKANFQKGCINFKSGAEVPLPVIRQLLSDCSKIDLAAMKQAWAQSKK